MTATSGKPIRQAPAVVLPPAMAALQKWRNADHEDSIRLSRDDVVTLVEEMRQQLADAQAAQALVVERAAEAAENVDYPWTQGDHLNQMDASDTTARAIAEAIRALASPSGVEALAALRAERDALKVRYDDLYADALADAKSDAQDLEGELWKAIRSILDDFDYDWSGDALEDGVTANEAAEFIRDVLDGETMRADTAIADRDALAAKLAAAEARVGALTEALECARAIMDTPIARRRLNLDPSDERLAVFRAALTTPAEETKG